MKSVKKYQEGGTYSGKPSVTQYFRPLQQEEMKGIRESLQEFMKKRLKKKKEKIIGTVEEKIDSKGPSRISTEQPERELQASREPRGRTRHRLLLDEIRRSAGFGRSSNVDLTRKTGPRYKK